MEKLSDSLSFENNNSSEEVSDKNKSLKKLENITSIKGSNEKFNSSNMILEENNLIFNSEREKRGENQINIIDKTIFKNEFHQKISNNTSEVSSPNVDNKNEDYFSKLFKRKHTNKNSLSDLEENDLVINEEIGTQNQGLANISFKKNIPLQNFSIPERLSHLVNVDLNLDTIDTSRENSYITNNSENISRTENAWSNKRIFGTQVSGSTSINKMDTNNTMNFLITNNSVNMLKMTNSISNDYRSPVNDETNMRKYSSKFKTDCKIIFVYKHC